MVDQSELELRSHRDIEYLTSSHEALGRTDNFPIDAQAVYDGKVRTVYTLSPELSADLINEHNYDVPEGTQLLVMIISDRISAFDAIWTAEYGLDGVPGKGAALNAISEYWFDKLKEEYGIENHIVDKPHPLVWIVAKAEPVMIEGVVRGYLTGSMWRAYSDGQREFNGVILPDGLIAHQKLDEVLVTPTTKGTIKGIRGVAPTEDAEITVFQIQQHHEKLGFKNESDVHLFLNIITQAFLRISEYLEEIDLLFVDTKFELGYIRNRFGELVLTFIDEIGTPDSSRMWDSAEYENKNIIQYSKEYFRQALLDLLPPKIAAILVDKKSTVQQRRAIASQYKVPVPTMKEVSQIYADLAEKITREPLAVPENPRAEITDMLEKYGLLKTN